MRRPMPRERSSLLPLMPSLMPSGSTIPMHGPSMLPPPGWGPPPSYDDACSGDGERVTRHIPGPRTGLCGSSIQPTHSFAGTSSGGFTGGGFFNNRSSASFAFHGAHHPPPRRLRLVTSHSENSFRSNPDGIMCPHPFSPTITVDPVSIFKQHVHVNQHHNNHNNYHHSHHQNYRHRPSEGNCGPTTHSNCSITHTNEYLGGNENGSPPNGSSSRGRNFRSLSQSQVLHRSIEEDDYYINHTCHVNGRQIPQSSSFLTNASGGNSEFSITSLSIPDNSSMSITMKSSNDIPLNDNTSSSHCCNINHSGGGNINHSCSLAEDDFTTTHNNLTEEAGFSDQEISLTSTNYTASAEIVRNHHRLHVSGGTTRDAILDNSSSSGAIGVASTCVIPNKTAGHNNASCATTSSEPKMSNAHKVSSFSSGQGDSNNVINSDTDIILNKKTLEFWGSLKKHKNFVYYGGGAYSTSRRRRKDKSKSSLSKISSLPSSPFMNMRRKLFGSGGKSMECVQNLNYGYAMPPLEIADVLGNGSNFGIGTTPAVPCVDGSDEFGNGNEDDKCSGSADQHEKSMNNSPKINHEEKVVSSDGCSIAPVRP